MTAPANIEFHPAADIFPLLEGEEFDALVADIKANGQLARIILKDGKVLDGRNRLRACLAAGIEPSFACEAYSDQITDPTAYVISANIRRRHLDPETKIKILAQLVAAQPEKSDRQLGEEAGVDHKTIAKARKKAEATGEASPVEKRVGKDGKARKQPAQPGEKKARTKVASKPKALGCTIEQCLYAVKVNVERALAAKPKNPEHQRTVFERVRECIDEMEQARGGAQPKATKARGKSARWQQAAAAATEALEELQELQSEYQDWRSNMPENLEHSTTAEKLDEVCDLDLEGAVGTAQEAEALDLPLGFGND